jgi:putative NIF3 family GTP cyclohydrolase 1 type 2
MFGTAAALLPTGRGGRQQAPLTAQTVVDRIKAGIAIPWRDTTVDGFKAGDPATVVTGIATTVMATLDVLRRASAAGRNMIITQEPVFYSGNDDAGNRANDAVYLAKKSFIDQNHLVVWRFSDHWNARRANDSAAALAARLGWSDRVIDAEQIYRLPPTTLGALTTHVRSRLGVTGGLRVIGESAMPVRTVFVNPGGATVAGTIEACRRADVILTGEPREWEVVPYALDTWSSGRGRGMIAIGRLVSEGPGMAACAAWIRTLVREVAVESLPTADPYWSPRT